MIDSNSPSPTQKITPTVSDTRCRECLQLLEHCFCAHITPVKSTHRVVILQYPREQFKPLNSATLVSRSLAGSVLTRGLSWRNLGAILDEEINPKEWGALFFKPHTDSSRPLIAVDRHDKELLDLNQLKGIIVLDGTWKQAKTLWWRNPWLVKLNRITLNPHHASLRRQVNTKYLSTIEAVALTLSCLGENPSITDSLLTSYKDCIVDKIKR